MGVHTGDSITVAPQQTLSDVEYQAMRDDAFRMLRRVGVETGGSNVQFAVNPATGERLVIEMNPRVSRSSALASKATGFPIAKIAARLAVGYTLNEIRNDITQVTPASFEPVIDYVVTKIPRWAFEKLPGSSPLLGTRMQSVGEVMAIGRNFAESLQKAVRSLEQGRAGFALGLNSEFASFDEHTLWQRCVVATPERLFALHEVLRRGASVERGRRATRIDPWFIHQLSEIVERERELSGADLSSFDSRAWRRYKQWGFSDEQIAHAAGSTSAQVRAWRVAQGVATTFKTVDTCAAEFEASTPYHYSTYEDTSEVESSTRDRVIILGSGPNRIGQGIEFDYCCVHASMALREHGLRDGHGELQPRDRLDGLLDVGSSLLRAANSRGRRRGHRGRNGRLYRRRDAQGRDRGSRRADATQALALARPDARPGHPGRCHRRGRGPRAVVGDLFVLGTGSAPR